MNDEILNNLLAKANECNNTGNYDEAEKLATSVLAKLENASDSGKNQTVNERKTLHCSALNSLATTNWRRGDLQTALALAHSSLDIAEEYALTQSKAKAWNVVGNVYYSLGSYDKALECYENALAEYNELGNKSAVANLTGNIGIVYNYLSSYDKSLEYYEQALAGYKELGDKSGEARVTGSIGSVYQHLGSYDKALECYEQTLTAHKELGDKSGVASVTGNIGTIYYSLGSYDKSLECYEQALAVHKELGEKSAVARVTGNIGGVYHSLGSNDKALECFEQALAVHKELGAKSWVAGVTGNIGLVYHSLGSYNKALECFEQALGGHKELGEISQVARVTGNIGLVYYDIGSYDKALEYYEQALATYQELGEKSGVASVTGNIGELYANKNYTSYDAGIAEEFLGNAIALCNEIGAKAQLVYLHKSIADLYENEERWKDAFVHHKKYIEVKDELNIEETKKNAEKIQREKDIAIAQAAANAKHDATTALLHRVLPESIATRMIAGEEDIADYFPTVSILFADIAGFTPIAADMPAYMVVRFLNYVFGRFDTIMKKHGCEKIKTIGDGYMAVAGAPIECADHAERMALAALEMQEDIRLPEEFLEYLPLSTDFGIRIGLHTGSVVGGVIGDERFVYDIYSDSVNTAARMESYSEPDKIHVSHDYYIHLQNRFAMTKNTTHGMIFEKRGEMAIKGKGMMKTYYLQKATL